MLDQTFIKRAAYDEPYDLDNTKPDLDYDFYDAPYTTEMEMQNKELSEPEERLKNGLLGGIAAPAALATAYYGPGAIASAVTGKKDLLNKWKNVVDRHALQNIPGIKKFKTRGGRLGAALGTLTGAGAIHGLFSEPKSKQITTPEPEPDFWDKTKNALTSDTAKTVAYTGGGGALGALLGNLIKGEDGSNAWPIILGLLGAGGGYTYANKDSIDWSKLTDLLK